jgi:hypothetical protein
LSAGGDRVPRRLFAVEVPARGGDVSFPKLTGNSTYIF